MSKLCVTHMFRIDLMLIAYPDGTYDTPEVANTMRALQDSTRRDSPHGLGTATCLP